MIRDLRGCHQERERVREGKIPKVSSAQPAADSMANLAYSSLLQNEMDDMFGFKCIFNGTASSHLSELCRKVRAKEGEGEGGKKNILSGDWELGQARNYMPF